MSKKEIYTYEAPWTIYGMNWSIKTNSSDFRLAIGSFVEEYCNKVRIVKLNNDSKSFTEIGEFDHPYPTTKIMWNPDASVGSSDILATTGDYLRIWKMTSQGVQKQALLNNNKNSEFCAPLTSFDWNDADPSMIGTSSVDTTCTIWDITTGQAKTQLIAHDREVFDIAFSAQSRDTFGTVGADGSVRLFDLRNLEHSTIIYESQDLCPLLRLSWNKLDPNYLVSSFSDATAVVVLDIRMPSIPVCELSGHGASVNAVAWAPHSSCHLCTAGDDSLALIWDLSAIPKPIEEPILVYTAEGEINNLQWGISQPDWLAIAFGNKLQILRV